MSVDKLRPWLRERGLLVDEMPIVRCGLIYTPTVRLFGSVTTLGCEIGAFSYVSPKTTLLRTTLGRYNSIGAQCQIGPTQHPVAWLTTSPITYKDVFGLSREGQPSETHDELSPVTIGNDIWIGTRAAVMGGVTISDGAIVAFGSVVTRDVEPYTVVGGVPARPIRQRFPDAVVERLLAEPWWRYDLVRTTHCIPWRDPLAALDAIAEGVEAGLIRAIDRTRYRLVQNGDEYRRETLD